MPSHSIDSSIININCVNAKTTKSVFQNLDVHNSGTYMHVLNNTTIIIDGLYTSDLQAINTTETGGSIVLKGSFSTTNSSAAISGTSTNIKLLGNISVGDGSSNCIVGTTNLVVYPSATANTSAAGTVTMQGATLNVNSAFKF